MLVLNCRNVLTKNYKWELSYVIIIGVVFKRLYKLKIPYFAKRSGLTDDVIVQIDKTVRKLNREE